MSERLVAVGIAVVGILIAWGCRWIAFHDKECRAWYLKAVPIYDQYYQPDKFVFAFIKFFGLAGHVLFVFGATMNIIGACLPTRLADFAMLPALIIAVFVCKRTLRGIKLSQQESRQA